MYENQRCHFCVINLMSHLTQSYEWYLLTEEQLFPAR